jgi:hypothetical protein
MLDLINPPTKILEKFLKTWAEREKTRTQYFNFCPSLSDGKDPAGIALTLSRRLISVVKAKNVLNIEAGLEMIALAMAISSEVCNDGFFLKPLINFPFFGRIMVFFPKGSRMSKLS